MPLTLLRHATQKPPIGPVKLDLGNPLSIGLVAATILNDYGSHAPYDYARQLTSSLTGTSWVSTAQGPAISVSVSGDYIEWPAGLFTKAITGDLSIAIRFLPTSLSTSYTALVEDPVGGGTRNLALLLNASGGSSKLAVGIGNNFSDGNATTISVNTWQDLVVTYTLSSNSIVIYSNGSQTATNGYSFAPTFGDRTLRFGSNGTGVNEGVFQGQYAHMLLWNRPISSAEALSVTAEPYAMFQTRPMQRWFTIVSAGGATIPPGLGPVVSLTEPTLTADLSSMMR